MPLSVPEKIMTIGCFRLYFVSHFEYKYLPNMLSLNFISPLTTHCVCFSCHKVLSHHRPIWSNSHVSKQGKMLNSPTCSKIQLFNVNEDTSSQGSKMLEKLQLEGWVLGSGH